MEIPPLVVQRMISMYQQGYSVSTIAEVTGLSTTTVRSRLIAENIFDSKRGIVIAPSKKPGKYDHLFEEPKAQGKLYIEYKKK